MLRNVILKRCLKALSVGTWPIQSRSSSTIYALSSGAGKAGIAVIRLSGSLALPTAKHLTNRDSLPPRRILNVHLKHPKTGDILDSAMVVFFQGPKSYTGEDVCEFHVHGGSAVIADVLEALNDFAGLRPAEPGEFTKRAFFNGNLDLPQVEGISDLINAETSAQRKLALRQADGDLSRIYSDWRQRLITATAHLEAYIDFGEEEAIEPDVVSQANIILGELVTEMNSHLRNSKSGERLRNGINVVITGKPNAGKSSLLNLLCRRPAAIVTPIAGTTRDTLDVFLNINGYPVLLTDTAGIRENVECSIEEEGIKRAVQRLKKADIVVLLIDASLYEDVHSLSAALQAELDNLKATLPTSSVNEDLDCIAPQLLVVLNKIDIIKPNEWRMQLDSVGSELSKCHRCPVIWFACNTQDGLDQFLDELSRNLRNVCDSSLSGSVTSAQNRHQVLLKFCLQQIRDYLNNRDIDLVIATQKLKSALHSLGKISGVVSTDDILDVVFRDFCIGK